MTLVFAAGAWAAGTLKVLQSFGTGNLHEGSDLYAGLILDSSGNVYGAAESGGIYGAGVVYELSPNAGGWTETVLYNFRGGENDGANPHATLYADAAGNLYGTAVSGGLGAKTCRGGCGAVFMLAPGAGGWQETVLYRFTGGADGSIPYAGVIMDSAGNLYGAALEGGTFGAGLVYKLTPGSAGDWAQTVLYTFQGRPDGSAPYPTPLLDAAGNLYGTTNTGGARNFGIAYMLAPQPDGSWTEHVLHTFKGGADGANPLAGLIFDPHGNLYGTTSYGGSANCGTAFKLAPAASGGWTERILHNFLGVEQQDGENPNGLTFGLHGDLFGTTTGGGTDNPGTIFKMTRDAGAAWKETVLYNFTAGATGAYPSSGVVLDPAGNIYGTTLWGGPSGDTTGGVAFEFTP
ncbi:MAG: choice-of-anchor tandem repeat GloVer-containing protein [Bryobacteraceae bacterium]